MQNCSFKGCTGTFDPAIAGVVATDGGGGIFTGWVFGPHDGDLPAHDHDAPVTLKAVIERNLATAGAKWTPETGWTDKPVAL